MKTVYRPESFGKSEELAPETRGYKGEALGKLMSKLKIVYVLFPPFFRVEFIYWGQAYHIRRGKAPAGHREISWAELTVGLLGRSAPTADPALAQRRNHAPYPRPPPPRSL